MKNYCYLFASRNNYNVLDEICFKKSDPKFKDYDIYNIDVDSTEADLKFGLEVMRRNNVKLLPSKNPLPMQFCINDTIKHLEENNIHKDWIILMSSDAYMSDSSYFERVDDVLLDTNFIDNVGVIGSATYHDGFNANSYGRTNLCKDSHIHPHMGWLNNLSKEYTDSDHFVIESAFWTWSAINIKLWKKYIKPDGLWKLNYSMDDVSAQFMMQNIPSICVPKLQTFHQTMKNGGRTSSNHDPHYYPEYAEKYTHNEKWYAKWGWPWGVRNEWNHNIRDVFDTKRYKNTLQEKLFNANISDGPIKLGDV
jgi:hypothetical protein